MIDVKLNEADATRRLSDFFLMGLDGNPATSEAGGQPKILIDGSWVEAPGIGVLLNPNGTDTGENPEGRYHAYATATAVSAAGRLLRTQYGSETCPTQPGETLRVVNYDPFESPGKIVLDRVVDNDVTLQQMLQALLALFVGTTSGAGGGVEVFKAPHGGQVRVRATLDERGNRTAMTLTFED